jgi:hypothetical protein
VKCSVHIRIDQTRSLCQIETPDFLRENGVQLRSEFVREYLNALRDGYHAAADDTRKQQVQ